MSEWLEYQRLVLSEIERLTNLTDKLAEIVSRIEYGDIPSLKNESVELKSAVSELSKITSSLADQIKFIMQSPTSQKIAELADRLEDLEERLSEIKIEEKKSALALLLEDKKGKWAVIIAIIGGSLTFISAILNILAALS